MAPKSKTKKAIASSLDYNEGPAPVWLAQINEHWKYGKSLVRLPQVDLRKPRQDQEELKLEVKQGKEQEQEQEQKQEGEEEKAEAKGQFNVSPQDDAKTEVATPQNNLKYWPANSFTSTLPLPSPSTFPSSSSSPFQPPSLSLSLPPSTFQPRPQPQHQSLPQSGFHVKSTSRGDDQSEKTVRPSGFYRGTRGRGDPRNACMKEAQARFRAEQAKRLTGLENSFPKIVPATASISSLKLDQSHPPTSCDLLPNGNTGRKISIKPLRQQLQTNEMTGDLPNSMALSNQTNYRSPLPPPQYPQVNGNASNSQNFKHLSNRAHNLPLRPPPQRKIASSSLPYRQDGAVARRPNDWSAWIELRVKIYGLPAKASTLDVWKCFSKEGSIAAIEIYEDRNGSRDGKAAVRFR